MNRREFIRTAGGAAGAITATSAAGTAAAQEGDGSSGSGSDGGSSGPIDYGGFLGDANGWGGDGSTTDARGQDEVTIVVGGSAAQGLSFDPVAVHVDPGATLVFEWSGEGGAHNVQTDGNQPVNFNSEIVSDEGFTFEQEIPGDASGIVEYFCSPHQGQGMLGAIAIGEVPRKSTGGPVTRTPPDPKEMGVPIQPHYVGIGTMLMMFASLLFTFFLLKYGESAHTKGGNN